MHTKFFPNFRQEANPAATADPLLRQNGCIDVVRERLTVEANRLTRNRLLEKTDHYEDDTTTVTVDESSLNDAAPPAIAVEFVLRSRESLAGRHYKDSETFIGSNESLLPAPMPKATSNRSIEQRKVAAEPVIAAQAAPPPSR